MTSAYVTLPRTELDAMRRALADQAEELRVWRELDGRTKDRRAEEAYLLLRRRLGIEPRAAEILLLLLSAPRVFTHVEIYRRLYGLGDGPDPKIIVVYFSTMRRRLRAAGFPEAIRTAWGVGYEINPADRPRLIALTQPEGGAADD